jgi:adenylate kinase family enzyme
LDGFPRTIIQAAGLDSILAQEKQPLNLALMLDVPDDIIVDRISSALLFFSCDFSGLQYLKDVVGRSLDSCPFGAGVSHFV